MRSLISIADLTNDEIEEIFSLADAAQRLRSERPANGQIMATLFYEPSTRTRLSFESAMQRLGGSVISCSDMKSSSVAKGETLADTAKVVSAYADVLVVRHNWDGAVQAMAEHADVPVINAGDGGHEHPTQTLCDLYTLRQEKGALKGLTVVVCGDLKNGRTIHSLVFALARFGAIGLKKYPSCYHTHRALDGVFQLLGEHRLSDKDIAAVDIGTSERAMRVLSFSEPATPYQAKYSMPYCIAAAVVDHKVTLETFTDHKFEDRNIVATRKKVHLSFPDVPIWPGLADVGPDTEFVGNPVTIRTTNGRSYSARVDIPRGDPALPLTDDELLTKYRDCGRSQLRPDDIERSVGLVLGLERVADIGALMATLRSALGNA